MTQLRQTMIRAMELKNLSNHTQRAYLSAVSGLAKHYQKSPEKITKEMIEDYLRRRFDRTAVFLQQRDRPTHLH
jgi:hypothetical protein